MAYFLQIKDNSGNYKSLNLEKSSLWQALQIEKAYKQNGAYRIQEINRFTMEFEDENALKNHLLLEGILPLSLEKNELVIRFIKNNNSKIRNYNLLFEDSLAYFCEPNILINLVKEKYNSNDFIFLNRLARCFYWFRECSSTALELINLTELAIKTGNIDRGYYEVDSNGDNLAVRLVKLLIFKYKQGANQTIVYSNEYNWRTFHILVDFINNYEKKLQLLEEKKKNSVVCDGQLNNVSTKKKRIKTESSQIPGQLDFNDLLEQKRNRSK